MRYNRPYAWRRRFWLPAIHIGTSAFHPIRLPTEPTLCKTNEILPRPPRALRIPSKVPCGLTSLPRTRNAATSIHHLRPVHPSRDGRTPEQRTAEGGVPYISIWLQDIDNDPRCPVRYPALTELKRLGFDSAACRRLIIEMLNQRRCSSPQIIILRLSALKWTTLE